MLQLVSKKAGQVTDRAASDTSLSWQGSTQAVVSSSNIVEKLSWVDKYAPASTSELPVYPGKIKKVREWLNRVFTEDNAAVQHGIPQVLALFGNSGACKSTTVEVVCKELGINLLEWCDDDVEVGVTNTEHPFLDSNDYGSAMRRIQSNTTASDMMFQNIYAAGQTTGQSNKMQQASITNQSIRSLFDISSKSSYHNHIDRFATQSNFPALSFTTKTQPIASVPMSNNNRPSRHAGSQRTIVLIHDPPASITTSYDSAASADDYLFQFNCPVVLVYSDLTGREDFHYNVDRTFPPQLQARIQLEAVQFLPITEKNIVKVLERILAKERALARQISKECRQAIALHACGDIRQAINQLQFLAASTTSTAPIANSANNCNVADETAPDMSESNHTTSSHNNYNNNDNDNNDNNENVIDQLSDDENDTCVNTRANNGKKPIGRNTTKMVAKGKAKSAAKTSTGARMGTATAVNSTNVTDSGCNKRAKRTLQVNTTSDDDDNDEFHSMEVDDSTTALSRSHSAVSNSSYVVAAGGSGSHCGGTASVVGQYHSSSYRDDLLNSFHCVGRLLKAKLDVTGKLGFDPENTIRSYPNIRSQLLTLYASNSADMELDILLHFLQYYSLNRIQSDAAASSNAAAYMSNTSTNSSASIPFEFGDVDVLMQIERTLCAFSDVDLFITRKFDPQMGQYDKTSTAATSTNNSHTFDTASSNSQQRKYFSNDSGFPDMYISSITARAIAANTAIGAKEHQEAVKDAKAPATGFNAHTTKFTKPPSLDIAFNRRHVLLKLSNIRDTQLPRVRLSTANGSSATLREIVTDFVPFYRVLLPVRLRVAGVNSVSCNVATVVNYNLLASIQNLTNKKERPTRSYEPEELAFADADDTVDAMDDIVND